MTKDRIEFARDLLDLVVEADRAEFAAETSDLRKAFHYAESLSSLSYWTCSELHEKGIALFNYGGTAYPFDSEPGYREPGYREQLVKLCPEFGNVHDLANAAKHRVLTRKTSTPAKHAANTHSTGTGFGMGGYGQGPFGGTPTVKIQVGKTDFVYFSVVADKTYEMWKKIFAENPL